MNANREKLKDAFTFSLGGQTLGSAACPIPAIDDRRINAAIAERLGRCPENQPDTSEELRSFWNRLWRGALRRAA